jgi:hypothetical protein
MELDKNRVNSKVSTTYQDFVIISRLYTTHAGWVFISQKTSDGMISTLFANGNDIIQVTSDEALGKEIIATLNKAYGIPP